MRIDDVHGGRVGQGDLVGVVAAGAHGVQVPKVAALRHAVLQRIVLDLLVHRAVELVPDVVARRHGLACKKGFRGVFEAFRIQDLGVPDVVARRHGLACTPAGLVRG